MTRLDDVLTQLELHQGEAVLLHAGQAPVMLARDGQAALPFPALTADEMRAIAGELVPPGLDVQLQRSGSAEFVVAAGSGRGRLAVAAIGSGDELFLEVRPSAEPAIPAVGIVHRGTPDPEPGRADMSAPASRLSTLADLKVLISRASSDGDAALFLRAGSVPALKLEGVVHWLDEYAALDAGDLERIVDALTAEAATAVTPAGAMRWTADGALVECRIPPRNGSAARSAPVEATLTIASTRPAPADRLGIPTPLVAACRDEFGLVVVAGPDGRCVSRTCHSLIDAINRDRPHHVIVLEPQAVISHGRRAAFVSHRVVTDDGEAGWMRAVDGAIAEGPDVLLVDRVPSWQVLARLLDRAGEALVIVKRVAPSALEAVEGLVADIAADQRAEALTRVADALTAVSGQREIKRRGGGAACSAFELIVGTPAVRDLIGRGAFADLALALERRVDGMISMARAVTELMHQGRITARQARAVVPGLAAVDPSTAAGEIAGVPVVDDISAEAVDLSDVLSTLAERTA